MKCKDGILLTLLFSIHVPMLFLAQVDVEDKAKVYNFVRVSNTMKDLGVSKVILLSLCICLSVFIYWGNFTFQSLSAT